MMKKISALAIDLAKGGFHVCAVWATGAVLCNRLRSRTRLFALLAEQRARVVAIEKNDRMARPRFLRRDDGTAWP